MAGITLKLEGLDQLRQMQALISPANFEKAQRAGIAKAAGTVKPQVAKGIGASYNLSAARIKQDISGVRIDSDGSAATIRFARRPPTLAQFKPSPGRRGRQPGLGRGMGWGPARPPGRPLSAVQFKPAGRQTFRGAFLAAGKNGNLLVLRREGDRLVALYGPSVGSIFLGQSKIARDLQGQVQQRLAAEFVKGFDKKLSDIARGYGGR